MGLMYDPQPKPEMPFFDAAYWAKLKAALTVDVNPDVATFGSLQNVVAALLERIEDLEVSVKSRRP
jgi:hypothetical protein